jgi:hypothetical protein
MADLPTNSLQRIAEARRIAETKLAKAISAVAETDDVARYLPAFTSFACAQLDAYAGERLAARVDPEAFMTALKNEATRIVEGILPDPSLNRVAGRSDEAKLIKHDMETGLLWEAEPDGPGRRARAGIHGWFFHRGDLETFMPDRLLREAEPDGTWKPARADVLGVYAQHGDWEHFMPEGYQFQLRDTKNYAIVQAGLSQVLQQRVENYWTGQFHLRSTTSGPGTQDNLRRLLDELPAASGRPTTEAAPATQSAVSGPIFPMRAAWLRVRLAEREWSKHDLQRHGGPEHRTTQKVLNGSAVQEEVLRKVVAGLRSKPTHKGLTLPAVAETDLPND